MKLHAFLERLRSKYLRTESEDLLFTNKACHIDGTDYRLNCWKDFHGKDGIVVFELKKKDILVTHSVCLGIRYSDKSDVTLLNEQQLWEIGIP